MIVAHKPSRFFVEDSRQILRRILGVDSGGTLPPASEGRVFIDDPKASLGMEMLRTKSPAMIYRELLMHVIS